MVPENQLSEGNFQQKLRALKRFVVISTILCALALVVVLITVPVDESVRAVGVVRAGEDSILYAPVDGTIGRILVFEGSKVKQGDALMELDTTELAQKLRESKAALLRAQAALDAEVAAFARARQLPLPSQFWHVREELSIAREKTRQAAVEFNRASEMQRNGLSSLQDVERAQLSLSINQSEEEKVKDKLRLIESGMENFILQELTARIQKARAEIYAMEVACEITRENISRCVIRAPADGTLSLLTKRRSGQAVKIGEDLLHLSHGEQLQAELFTTESEIHRVKTGLRVRMQTPAFNPIRYGYIEGTVSRIPMEALPDVSLQTPSQGARFRVIATIDSSPQPLVIGSTIEASIVLRRVALWRLLLPAQ